VLVALHLGGEKPIEMINRLGGLAGQNGYILVAPEWARDQEQVAKYSPGEHEAVLDVLRDLRRRFQVDSDRIFLLGFGQGGNLAYDIGLSHPDQFAGLLLIGAQAQNMVRAYWHNNQLLPLYLVDGELSGGNPKSNRPLLEKWIPHGYPAMYVEYKGRGIEWYVCEVPIMFDWMNHKRDTSRRATGFPELGKNGNGGPLGEEYQTERETDNHFYWLSTNSISDRCLNDPENWSYRVSPATLHARISEGNLLNINVRGVKQVSVWLGKDMIEFSKPLTARINGGTHFQNRIIKPNVGTMLEDFYQRCDRQRLYWARLDFDRL
jgi:pimeloyl-ACP methyl ester carboxylesterase